MIIKVNQFLHADNVFRAAVRRAAVHRTGGEEEFVPWLQVKQLVRAKVLELQHPFL